MIKRGSLALAIFIFSISVTLAASTCEDIHITETDSEKALDITFVKDGYIPNSEIRLQLYDLIETMRELDPFKDFIDSKINIRFVSETESLDCCKVIDGDENDPGKLCDHVKVIDWASTCPDTDEIVVFSNNGNLRNGEACNDARAVGAGGQHSVIYRKPGGSSEYDSKRQVSRLIIHEIGHSMAFLDDEYIDEQRDSIGRKLEFVFAPNCEKNPILEEGKPPLCPKWRNVPRTDCIQGCTHNESYRPVDAGIMRHPIYPPSPIDKLQFRSAMYRYVDYVKEPISIEVHQRTEEFIINKFLENNAEGFSGEVPLEDEFSISLSEDWPSYQEDLSKIATSALSGGNVIFACDKFTLESEQNPQVKVFLENMETTHNGDELILDIEARIIASGKVKIAGEGFITSTNPLGALLWTHDCSDGLIFIDWETDINPIQMRGRLNFDHGPLGIARVFPELNFIQVPDHDLIQQGISLDAELAPSQLSGIVIPLPVDLAEEALQGIGLNEYTPTFIFATTLKDQESELNFHLHEMINNNLDEFGLSLKASLDGLGLEELANTGKPHGMILDVYLEDTANTNGIELGFGSDPLRMSGLASFNTPLQHTDHQASCVKDTQLNFNPIPFSNFNRRIGTPSNSNPFASLKLTQSFPNWFIANLHNGGFFCGDKEIPISDELDFLDFDLPIIPMSFEYVITPLNPPYLNYDALVDTNNDGITDINNDVVAQGTALIKVELKFELESDPGVLLSEAMEVEVSYIVPLVLEEKDISRAIDEGFSLATSVFKSDIDDLVVDIEKITCLAEGGLCLIVVGNKEIESIFIQELKENVASHADRALQEIEINPVRDVDLNFGVIGADYFTPGINLNYGEYIAQVKAREIQDKWMIYDFDLIPKCSESENCGNPFKARLRSIEEVFYKVLATEAQIPSADCTNNFCKCIKDHTEESKACIDALITADGEELHHYIKAGYDSAGDFVTYNFNLINWNSYKPLPGEIYYVYLAESPTYNRLRDNIDFQIENDANIHKLTNDATQVIAFRSKTRKGVEQDLECVASVILDKSEDMFDYSLRGALITIEQRLRSDVNDIYTVCAFEDHQSDYIELIFPADIISYT